MTLISFNKSEETEKTEKTTLTEEKDEGRHDDLELPFFDLTTILKATNNFSIENKLGEGGFGPVYKVNFQNFK